MGESATPQASSLQLGAFIGVFTPTILTILGVIMYLRTGWVVGNAGLAGTLAIVVLSNAITLITALSMSALATNMRVGVGGAYYLISRSMGLELGGSIGIPLYLSQVLSVTLYAYGLAETVRLMWAGAPIQPLAIAIIIFVTFLADRSTTLVLKLQVPIMLLILASLISLYTGVDWGAERGSVIGSWSDKGFWGTFAVFFPAVTGVLAGVSLSGDLRNPARAIPVGALAAVLVGFLVYLTVPVALYFGATTAELQTNSLIWTDVASVWWLVLPGCWGAILSSAFGSILGAPRTLQALSADSLAPQAFSRVSESSGEPVFGLRASGLVALVAALLLPDLDTVATWVTVFFLTTYGALNLIAGAEGLVGDPSFRPRIRIPWFVSLLGALGCFIAMFAISPLACSVAIAIEAFIFWFLSRRSLESTWGDVRNGLWLSGARWAMLRLQNARLDPRNWRPHILVFTASLERNVGMVQLANQFGHHRGIVTVMTMLLGDIEDHEHAAEILRRNRRLLGESDINAFCEVAAVPDLDAGFITIAQSNGFGGLDSNTVMFGWPGADSARVARLIALTRKLSSLHKCTLIYRPDPSAQPHARDEVLLWWKGLEHNGDLMALLAHLLVSSTGWQGSRIVLKSVADSLDEARSRRAEFAALLPQIRIQADVEVLVRGADDDASALIREHSVGARLVMIGLGVVESDDEVEYGERVISLVEGMPDVLLVRNEGPFRGRLI